MNNFNSIQRGDIYYVSHSKNYATDSFSDGNRPAVIVSNNILNNSSDYVEIVYLTSKDKRQMSTHANVLCKVPSVAMCETIFTISKDRLGDFVRTLSLYELKSLDNALMASLGIETDSTVFVHDNKFDKDTVELKRIETERDLYKQLYESILDKVIAA